MTAKIVLGIALAVAAGFLLVAGAGACSSASSSGGSGGPGSCANLSIPSTCPSPPPSWKTQVQPFVETYCNQCHGTGGIAAAQVPMATYQDVVNNRERAWEQVYNCAMPNDDASPPPNAYPSLAERQLFVNWADICNAPNN